MKRKVHTIFIALFTFLLVLQGSILAHNDEHQTKSGDGSSELHEEGSGMRNHSEKNGEYKEHGDYDKHEKSSEYYEEGSGMKVHSKKNGDYKEHGNYDKHGKPSEHTEEGSGMR